MSIKWETIKNFEDIKYESGMDNAVGIAKITINRPDVRNAFRPKTVFELKEAFTLAREDKNIGTIILTGQGNDAFCSGGDQKIRGDAGYIGDDGVPRLNILDFQNHIRYLTIKEQPEVDITTNPNATTLHSVRMGFLLYIHKDHNYILDFYIFHSCKPCLSPICFGRAIIASTLFTNFYFYDFIITISHLFLERNTTM